MVKAKKYYAVAWIIAVVVFHIIMFLLPNMGAEMGIELGRGTFWVIYLSIFVSLIGQAACSFIYAGKEKKEERFLYIPVVLISYIALLMNLLLALEALTLSFLPTWFTVIVAFAVLAFYALAIVRTIAAADMVVETGKRIEQQTDFVRTLTANAKALEQNADAGVKKYVTKVYESLRYSDPVSAPELSEVEEQIQTAYQKLAKAVRKSDEETTKNQAADICALIKERNELCKIKKH